jgi:hypothetical protein
LRIITVGRTLQFQARVSDEDYDHLIQFLWTYGVSHRGGSLIYVRRSIRSGGANITILMHHVVLERDGKPRPSNRHTCDHGDGDPFNNQRENLNWRTPKQQLRNRQVHRAQPIWPHSIWLPPAEDEPPF